VNQFETPDPKERDADLQLCKAKTAKTDFYFTFAFKVIRIAPFLRFLLKPETVIDSDKNANNPICSLPVQYGTV
jgi:hypothetical protein